MPPSSPDDICLSVVLATYNHEDTIREALDSVLMQETGYRYEIVVVDDCSTDGTSDIVADYAARHPGIIRHVRLAENAGRTRLALFKARPILKGRYWCTLEGDDYWTDRQKIQKQVGFLEANPDYLAATSAYTIHDVLKDEKTVHKAALESWDIRDMIEDKHPLYSHTSTWVWRNIFREANPDGFHLHETLSQPHTFGDTCLSIFMMMQGGRVKCFEENMSCYRLSGKGMWSSLSEEERARRNRQLLHNIDRITDYRYSDILRDRLAQPAPSRPSLPVRILRRIAGWPASSG